MNIKNLQDEPICECGGYITGIYIAEHDQYDDIAIQTVLGRCDKCGKENGRCCGRLYPRLCRWLVCLRGSADVGLEHCRTSPQCPLVLLLGMFRHLLRSACGRQSTFQKKLKKCLTNQTNCDIIKVQ